MGEVRPFVREDIPQVAELHRRVFRTADGGLARWLHPYERYFSEVFLKNPWCDEALPSLVYEDDGGRIIGFLGVMPRWMLMNGRPLRMAIASQFIVDPDRRGLVGLKLLKAFFDGPQDLSITDEANDATRRIWEGRGGTTSVLYSIHWLRPLRPGRFAVAFLRKRKRLLPVAWVSSPFARILDALAARVEQRQLRPSTPQVSGEDLCEATFLAGLPELTGDRALRPQYDDRSLKWLLQRAGRTEGDGRFQKVVLKNGREGISGWYVYYINAGGIGEVLQIAARRDSVCEVLDHLLSHALLHDAIALSGRLEPAFVKELAERHCLFHARGPWMLIHSRKPAVLDAIHRGDAFLTRLEGEWCMRFELG